MGLGDLKWAGSRGFLDPERAVCMMGAPDTRGAIDRAAGKAGRIARTLKAEPRAVLAGHGPGVLDSDRVPGGTTESGLKGRMKGVLKRCMPRSVSRTTPFDISYRAAGSSIAVDARCGDA